MEAVCDYVAAGLELGETAVLAVEDQHAPLIRAELQERGYGPLESRTAILSANSIADEIAAGDALNEDRFNNAVLPELKKACSESKTGNVRVYGEIVNMFWKSSRTSAAMQLEGFWEKLLEKMAVRLLCGYRTDLLDGRCEQLLECHEESFIGLELNDLGPKLENAIDIVMGSQTSALKGLVAGQPQLKELPPGHGAFLWLSRHMPSVADRIVSMVGPA